MTKMNKDKKHTWHKVRGYATEEEYKQLQELPDGAQLKYLREKLHKITVNKGRG